MYFDEKNPAPADEDLVRLIRASRDALATARRFIHIDLDQSLEPYRRHKQFDEFTIDISQALRRVGEDLQLVRDVVESIRLRQKGCENISKEL
jgi:hypothetical protein